MSYKKENYRNLLVLSGGDISVFTTNKSVIKTDVNKVKYIKIEPLYESNTRRNKGVSDMESWMLFSFDSDVIDLYLDPVLTLRINTIKAEAEVCYLESPGLNLTAFDNNNEITSDHKHLNALFFEWTEFMIENDTRIKAEQSKKKPRSSFLA